jgi:hypothetical protein
VLVLAACAGPGLEGFETRDIRIGDQALTVAVADTPSLRQQGLRGVEALPEGLDGVLFVFEETRPAVFGMLDTLIPLDIWWFDEEGALVGLTEMRPCPAEPCPDYASPGSVARALETPAGEFAFPAGAKLSSGDNP